MNAFHDYFVVSSPNERFRILFMAITVTWSVTLIPFLPTQQIRSIVNGAAARGPSDYQVNGRVVYLIITGCVIDRAVPSAIISS